MAAAMGPACGRHPGVHCFGGNRRGAVDLGRRHVAVLLLGATAAAGALLGVLGPLRVVLRYAERLVTHNATFRALADLRVWFFQRLAARSAGGLGDAALR